MNKNSLFIPTICKVGFNQRTNTYSGKLGYVIGKDKNKWRKEKSWSNWVQYPGKESRYYNNFNHLDDSFIPHEFNNNPRSGFVLNRKAGGYNTGWNTRRTVCRVYDPLGFEIEIGIDNLLFILEHYNSEVGKALNGEFVYAWDKTDLILLPTESIDYKESIKFIKQKEKIGVRDLIQGNIYLNNKNEKVIYLDRNYYYDKYNGSKSDKTTFWFYNESLDKIEDYKTINKRIVIDTGESVDDYVEYHKKLYDTSWDKKYHHEVYYLTKEEKEKLYDHLIELYNNKNTHDYYSSLRLYDIREELDSYLKEKFNYLLDRWVGLSIKQSNVTDLTYQFHKYNWISSTKDNNKGFKKKESSALLTKEEFLNLTISTYKSKHYET